ncbi:MAG: hypothetical protein FWF49_02195, partial [Oscillospiraceae bacterium]|nr:hypothetical protein [Oscillospiraceae bacterium]
MPDFHRPSVESASPDTPEQDVLVGRNAVLEALKAGRPLNSVWVAQRGIRHSAADNARGDTADNTQGGEAVTK